MLHVRRSLLSNAILKIFLSLSLIMVMMSNSEVKAGDASGFSTKIEPATLLQKLEAELVQELGRKAKEKEARQALDEGLQFENGTRQIDAGALPISTGNVFFDLAYNGYLHGYYDLAVDGFNQFLKDFPNALLAGNAHYWLGESYYQKKDYLRAMQAFEYVSNEYPGNEKTPASLFKLGMTALEIGDLTKSQNSFKLLLEVFPSSPEAKLARTQLPDLR